MLDRLSFWNSDGARDVVPPVGASGWSLFGAAAALVLIASLAAVLAQSASSAAAAWQGAASHALTVRVDSTPDAMDAAEEAVLRVLRTTPGVKEATPLGEEDQTALLEPWLGGSDLLNRFHLPRLVAVEIEGEGPDVDGLRLRLSAEVPGADLLDHGAWWAPAASASDRLSAIAYGAAFLALLTLFAVVMLAARAAMAENRDTVTTLRLLGARDSFIARAFVLEITRLAALGALCGAVLAALLLLLVPDNTDAGPLGSLQPSGAAWILLPAIAIAASLVGYLSARGSVRAILNRLS